MKRFLTALSLLLFGLSVSAQDTITSYIDFNGRPSDFLIDSYFQKRNAKGTIIYKPVDDAFIPKQVYRPGELQIRNGRFILMNSKGEKMMDVTFVNDKIEGVSKRYFEGGQLADSALYKDGILNGRSIYFHPNGQISSIEEYKEGFLQSAEIFDENGRKNNFSNDPTIDAEYPNGLDSMNAFLARNIEYPEIARDLGLEGKCILQFMVDFDGTVKDLRILRGVPDCFECDKEAMRVVKLMPKWKPGKVHNRVDKSYFYLPVSFTLVSAREMRKARKGKK